MKRPVTHLVTHLAALAAAALVLSAAGPAPKVEPINSLALSYDPALWRVEKAGNGIWRAAPVDEGQSPSVTIDTNYGGPCSQEAMAALAYNAPGFQHGRKTATLPSGLTAHFAFGATGCRNATASPMAACVVHQGTTYLFKSESMGCRGNPYGDAQAEALLQGLRPRF